MSNGNIQTLYDIIVSMDMETLADYLATVVTNAASEPVVRSHFENKETFLTVLSASVSYPLSAKS